MIKFLRLLLLFCILATFASCLKNESRIIPLAEVKTLSQIQKEMIAEQTQRIAEQNGSGMGASFYRGEDYNYFVNENLKDVYILRVNYKIEDLDVYELGETGYYQLIGSSVMEFFAKFFFKLGGEYQKKMDNITFELPDMEIDRDMIKEIRLQRVTFTSASDQTDLAFLKRVELTTPLAFGGRTEDALLFGYQRQYNKYNPSQAMDIDLYTDDIVPWIIDKKTMDFTPTIDIDQLPSKQLKVSGEAVIDIAIKLPF